MAFETLPDGKKAPIGKQSVQCNMVFHIKIEDSILKARFVAGVHMSDTPATITYASTVSRETVRRALIITTLIDLKVKLGDI